MLHSVYRSEFARARGLGVSFLLEVYDPVCRRSVGLSVIISQKNGKLRLHAPIGALFMLCLFGFHKGYSVTIKDNIFHICTYIHMQQLYEKNYIFSIFSILFEQTLSLSLRGNLN